MNTQEFIESKSLISIHDVYSDIIHKRQSQEQPKCLLRDDDQVKKVTHNRGSLIFEKEKKNVMHISMWILGQVKSESTQSYLS